MIIADHENHNFTDTHSKDNQILFSFIILNYLFQIVKTVQKFEIIMAEEKNFGTL